MANVMKLLLTMLVSLICLLAQTSTSMAQRRPAKERVILRNIGMAKVSVSRGGFRRRIDLSGEVAGCQYVAGTRNSMMKKRGCAAPPATFTLIDSTTQDSHIFLIVLSQAMDNCNVCGMCGATEAYALIWLELDPSLRPRNKRSVTVEDCRDSISLLSPESPAEAESARSESTLKLPFKGDTLVVEFEKMLFSEDRETKSYRFSRLEYSRKQPALGLVVTSEARAKSSAENP